MYHFIYHLSLYFVPKIKSLHYAAFSYLATYFAVLVYVFQEHVGRDVKTVTKHATHVARVSDRGLLKLQSTV